MECESRKVDNIAEMSIGCFLSDKIAPKYTYSSISMIINKIKPIIIDAHKQFSRNESVGQKVADFEFLDCMETEIFLLTFIQTLTNFNDEDYAIVNHSELSALLKLSKWMQLCHNENQISFINNRIENLNSNYHSHASCNKDSFDPSETGLDNAELVYECLLDLFKIGDYKQMLEIISRYPGDFQWIGLIINYFCEFFEGTKAWDKCFIKICESHLKTHEFCCESERKFFSLLTGNYTMEYGEEAVGKSLNECFWFEIYDMLFNFLKYEQNERLTYDYNLANLLNIIISKSMTKYEIKLNKFSRMILDIMCTFLQHQGQPFYLSISNYFPRIDEMKHYHKQVIITLYFLGIIMISANDFDNLLMTSIDQVFIGIEDCRDMLTFALIINDDSMREKALIKILTESESFDKYVEVFVENFFLDSSYISQKVTDMMEHFYNTIDSVLCNHSLLEDALQNDMKLINNLQKLLFNMFVYKNRQICCLDGDTNSNIRPEIDFQALKLINKMILFYFKTKRFQEVVTLHNQLIDTEGYEFDRKSYEPSRLLLFTLDELSMNFEDHQKYNPINVLFTILYQMSSTFVTKELCIKLANTTEQRYDNEDQSQFDTSYHLLQQTLDSLCQFNLALEFIPNIFMELPNFLSKDDINAIEISLFNLIIDFCVAAKKGCMSSTNAMTDLSQNDKDFHNIVKKCCDFLLTKDNKLLGFLNKDHRMQATIFVTEIAL